MKQADIKRLLELNEQFYQKNDRSFANTRPITWAWTGWKHVIPSLHDLNQPLKVLDIGCGNGRFGAFLYRNDITFSYTGIDDSSKMIQKANKELSSKTLSLHFSQQQVGWSPNALKTDKQYYSVVAIFGLMHHIPSIKLRTAWMRHLCHLVDTPGLLLISFWKFLNDDRKKKQAIPLKSDTARIILGKTIVAEKNDFLLPWQHSADFRYCHHFNSSEITQMLREIRGMRLIKRYVADGKHNLTNEYVILKKT